MKKLILLPLATLLMLTGCNQPSGGGDGGDPEPSEPVLLVKYDFSAVTAKGSKINADVADDKFASYKVDGEGSITISEINLFYEGNGRGGALENQGGMLKFGKGDENAKLVFTANETIKKMVLNCHSFYVSSEEYPVNDTNLIKVNGADAVALPYNANATGEDLEFTIDSKTVTIETANNNPTEYTTAGRGFLFSLTLYK